MIPLHPVVLGLVVVALRVQVDGLDLLADWVGWVIVLIGSASLPVRRHGMLLAAAGLACAAGLVTWFPDVSAQVAGTDDALSWALSLPQSAYLVLLADGLRDAAKRGGDPALALWWAWTAGLATVALVLPVLVLGGDVTGLGPVAALVALTTLVLVLVLGLASARATWAGGHPRPLPGPPTGPDGDSGPKTPRAS